jgi:hypothetical protein
MGLIKITLLVLALLCSNTLGAPPIPFREPPKYEISPENQLQLCCNCCPYDSDFGPNKPKPLCIPMSGAKCNSMGWACYGYVFCPK